MKASRAAARSKRLLEKLLVEVEALRAEVKALDGKMDELLGVGLPPPEERPKRARK